MAVAEAGMAVAEADMPVVEADTAEVEADTLAPCVAVRHFEAVVRSAGVPDIVAE
jgi:hypothetical protein